MGRAMPVDERSRGAELQRFDATRTRRLGICPSDHIAGKTILITGGTGCVGTALIGLLKAMPQSCRIVSVSRGLSFPLPASSTVRYETADIRDRHALQRVIKSARPDIVVHLAAVRDPGYAETHVGEALSTNIAGWANVLDASRVAGAECVVAASTGKAMRFLTRDVYAASKKIGEYLACDAAIGGLSVRSARFTHIVDNSLILRKLNEWTRDQTPITLHGPDIQFYVQSVLEAAELLIALMPPALSTRPVVAAQRELGQPISLTTLAMDVRYANASSVPVVVIGHEPGYEEGLCPGTYDPRSAGETTPLFNAFEVDPTSDKSSPFDTFGQWPAADDPTSHSVRQLLGDISADGSPQQLRDSLRRTSRDVFRWTLRGVDHDVLHRALRAAERGGTADVHHDVLEELRQQCSVAQSAG